MMEYQAIRTQVLALLQQESACPIASSSDSRGWMTTRSKI
jgi:hypothetical protein